MIDAPDAYGEDDAREFIARGHRGWEEGSRAVFAIAGDERGEALGVVDLHLRVGGDSGLASAGYWLLPDARGRGVATRALQAAARTAFSEFGVERLFLTTAPDNVASQRVAERAGFTREGLLRAHLQVPGGRRDSVMYSLLPGDLGS